MSKTPESNSASVLASSSAAAAAALHAGNGSGVNPNGGSSNSNSASKSMALESRLAGANALDATNGLAHATSAATTAAMAAAAAAFQVKTEPSAHTYFPTDASVLSTATMGVRPAHRVAEQERDRYFAESRRLRQELALSLAWRRRERHAAAAIHAQFDQIARTFEREMQTVFQIGAVSPATTPAPPSSASAAAGAGAAAEAGASASGVATTTASTSSASSSSALSPSLAVLHNDHKSHHEDLVALRQKLLEVNHALARQQTEILELKERDARHALHETRRIKLEMVRCVQRRMADVIMAFVQQQATAAATAAASGATTSTTTPPAPLVQRFDDRVEGVRPSCLELLFPQHKAVVMTALASSSLSGSSSSSSSSAGGSSSSSSSSVSSVLAKSLLTSGVSIKRELGVASALRPSHLHLSHHRHHHHLNHHHHHLPHHQDDEDDDDVDSGLGQRKKLKRSRTIDLELDHHASSQVLGWNLVESARIAPYRLDVRLEAPLHVSYEPQDEVLLLRYSLQLLASPEKPEP
ncbi:hypothetical protein PINS_up012582 [Pythium insidiosum]|nr:hypothetical protein PINS_up012582 [Pythium insidiosum]